MLAYINSNFLTANKMWSVVVISTLLIPSVLPVAVAGPFMVKRGSCSQPTVSGGVQSRIRFLELYQEYDLDCGKEKIVQPNGIQINSTTTKYYHPDQEGYYKCACNNNMQSPSILITGTLYNRATYVYVCGYREKIE